MIDFLITVPTGTNIKLPANPTAEQLAVDAAVKSVCGEWKYAGSNGTLDLHLAITRAASVSEVEILISSLSLPWTVVHAQDAYGSTVHIQAAEADLLQYAPDDIVYDEFGAEVSRSPATSAKIGSYSGHSDWKFS